MHSTDGLNRPESDQCPGLCAFAPFLKAEASREHWIGPGHVLEELGNEVAHRCVSISNGNTRRVADRMAEVLDAEVVEPEVGQFRIASRVRPRRLRVGYLLQCGAFEVAGLSVACPT